jgi:hypothetical protein
MASSLTSDRRRHTGPVALRGGRVGYQSTAHTVVAFGGTTNTVNKANLSLTATVPTLAVYSGNSYTGSFRSTALGSDSLTVSGLAIGTNVGSYISNLVVSGAALANYNTPQISNATLVITPKPVSISNTPSSEVRQS